MRLPVPVHQPPLVHFENARRELELARTVDEVKEIRDPSEAMRLYCKQAGNGSRYTRVTAREEHFLPKFCREQKNVRLSPKGDMINTKGARYWMRTPAIDS